jgi:integrase
VREYPRRLEARPPLTQAKVNYREWLDPSLGAWPAGKGHVVPLSDWAIEELEKLKVMADRSRYVLPNADQSGPADPKSITRSVARCLKRFKKHGVGAFTPHDLRRTGRTGTSQDWASRSILLSEFSITLASDCKPPTTFTTTSMRSAKRLTDGRSI